MVGRGPAPPRIGLDLKDTERWKQKAWRAHTWTSAPASRVELYGRVPGPWSAYGHISENHLEEDATRLLRKQVGAWCTSVAPPGHSPPWRAESPQRTEEIAGNSDSIKRGERLRRQLSLGYRLRESRRRAREVGHLQVLRWGW